VALDEHGEHARDFKAGRIEFARMVGNLERTLDAGEYHDKSLTDQRIRLKNHVSPVQFWPLRLKPNPKSSQICSRWRARLKGCSAPKTLKSRRVRFSVGAPLMTADTGLIGFLQAIGHAVGEF
jgi:hypothetical protein